jgi:L-ornithine N5-oxygenase
MVHRLRDTYDIIGIGFGPANIALAVALEESGFAGDALFLERAAAPDWQSEMMLDGSDIQHNPLRDFVTPRNPRSHYSFVNFLHTQGRLLDFLNLDTPFPLRKDYAMYIRWVARHFDRWTAYAHGVSALRVSADGEFIEVVTPTGQVVRGRSLAFGPGRSPLVPQAFRPHLGERVTHFTNYLTFMAQWRARGGLRSVAVVGASQSAVELILDLRTRCPDLAIHGIQRGFGFRLKDTSPFTERAYMPAFVDYFYDAVPERQRAMTADLWRSNYGAADADVIHTLHLALYEQKLDGRHRIDLHEHSDIAAVNVDDAGVAIDLVDRNHGMAERVQVDAVILATGFRNFGAGAEQELFHPLLADVMPRARRREDGSAFITRTYALEQASPDQPLPPIFVNGLCESTHGFGDAGSFSLLAQRSGLIAGALSTALAACPAPVSIPAVSRAA